MDPGVIRVERIGIEIADPALGDVSQGIELEVRHRNADAVCAVDGILWEFRREFAEWTYSRDCGLKIEPRDDRYRPLDTVLLRLIAVVGGRIIWFFRDRGLEPPYEIRLARGPWRFILPLPS
jgi:hypothetical protein